MEIVVLDGYTENPGDLSWDGLAGLGRLTVYDRTPQEEVITRIQGAEAVFTNKTVLSGQVLSQCPRLKFIGVLATGYNVVDCHAAAARGIVVSNVPGYSTDSVAQHTIALLLELCHHVGSHSQAVRQGEWGKCQDFCFWKYPLTELAGKTMGIIGFGNVGRKVAALAQAFGMRVLACRRRSLSGGECPDGVELVELQEIYQRSDVISLHCPLTEENKEMINHASIGRMKEGVWILNTARGGLICEADLREALQSGKVGAAAADVLSTEPPGEGNPLLGAPNMLITPHIAWAPREARGRLMEITVANLKAFQDGNPIHVVNGAEIGKV